MQYYLIENEEQVGPLSLEELKKKGISKNTLVWLRGLDNWTKAKDIPLINEILDQGPPPYKKVAQPVIESVEPTVNPYFGYQPASRWERFLAALIGGLLIFIPITILTKGEYLRSDNYFTVYDFIIELIVATLAGGLLYPLWTGNLGHKIFGLKVVYSNNGQDVKIS